MNNVYKSPDVVAASLQVTINQLLEKETAAQRYTSVYASAGYNYSRSSTAAGNVLLNQNYGPYVGLSLNVPIYNGSIYKYIKALYWESLNSFNPLCLQLCKPPRIQENCGTENVQLLSVSTRYFCGNC